MADNKDTLSENALGWFWLALVFAALGWLCWFLWHDQLKDIYRWIKWSEMWVISWFVGDDYTVRWGPYAINFHEWLNAVPNASGASLDEQQLSIISTLATQPMRWPAIIILTGMGLWAIMWGPGTQFRRKMGLDQLIPVQAKNFPVIAPFINFNPNNQPPRAPGMPVPAELPLFAEALGPEEWLAYHQIPVPDGRVDEHAAFVAFARQLGPRWQGPMKMPPYRQVLLAAFCLKAARKRKESDTMLGELAMCWDHEKGLNLKKNSKLYKWAIKVLKDKGLCENTLAQCNQHAFQNTVLIRALQVARQEGGVLAPGMFTWLRGYDRALWYPLNNLGRQANHMEAMGAICHFKMEKRTMRPIPKPKVEDAVKSIVDYMASEKARPIPPLDYSKSKNKSGIKKPKKK